MTFLLFSASPALASRGHSFSSTFSGPCTLEPCEGKLKEPEGLAVNEANGDIYVVDKGANRVVRFNAAGTYQSEINGTGKLPGEGAAAGSGAGGTGSGAFKAPEGVAVDNSCALLGLSEPTCKAEDPSNGDVYVVDAGHRVVDKYTASGEYVSQISANGGGRFSQSLDGVAVDPRGHVWVYRETPAIDGYKNDTANTFASTIEIPGLAGFGIPGIAVDSHGNFYVRRSRGEDFVGRISKVDSTGNVLIDELDEEPSPAVATDQVNDNSFVQNTTTVGVFDTSGKELERLGREKGEQHLLKGAGIAVDARTETLYVADAAAKQIVVFGPVQPSAPTIESGSAAGISAEAATLEAEIDPRSEAGEEPTEYRFVYGACAGGGVESCAGSGYPSSAPAVEGQLGPGFEAQAVSVPIQGLTPGTTYHFKALAHNALGAGEGSEATFTTQSAGGPLVLPDDRGWELVSPPDKQGSLVEPIAEVGVVQAAADGGAITYLANAPLEAQPRGAANKSQALSRRSANGWSSTDISLPHENPTGAQVGQGQEYKFFDGDLLLSVVQPFGPFNPSLSEEASESTAFLHNLTVPAEACTATSSCFVPLVTRANDTADPFQPFGEGEQCIPRASEETTAARIACGPEALDATEDLSHIVFRASAPLRAGAGEEQLYEWAGGVLQPVSVLPGGASAVKPGLGFHKDQWAPNAISADGSRIVWEAEGALYQRDTSRGETVQLDAGCGGCESGGGEFQTASADGSRVFFTDAHRLSKDSGANPASGREKYDLYECQITIEAGKAHCALTDLTPLDGAESADVQGRVLGASVDGEYVYFVANGVQSTANTHGASPHAGTPNLYERHGATTSFIATLSPGDEHDWDEELGELVVQPTRVSANGRYLELMSQASLTGYDNRDVTSGQPTAEVYLFDATTSRLMCASCDPTGARPVGVEYFKLEPGSGGLVGGPRGVWPKHQLVAANVPGTTQTILTESRYQPRYLNDQGRLFFDTVNGLVSQDSNNTQDVYEYEPPGIEGPEGNELCTSASETYSARSGGCVNLISSGKSTQESAFLDASESGDDVFFLTAARLSKLDTDDALDVYDAHVCSDSPCVTPAASPAAPCEAETSCRAPSPPQPSPFSLPTSAILPGAGNLTASTPPPVVKRSLTRAQKLAGALRTCKKDKRKRRRQACEKQAHKRYGPLKKAKRRKK